ncbi:MAG: aminotransferase class I/II-fold pyridoxal phosphate-dependent enzyme [Bacteroidales bacterium]|jgi:LL-diaminopimelate aminotransferase|nr:aminotransferase class I/II-fold pyridoxal phosphate-dependent enzyme [Bacteroidales bacterium]
MSSILIQPANRIQTVNEYYFSTKLAEIRKMNANGHSVINLGIGNPDLAPSANTINELIQTANDPVNHGYQSYTGIPELREAFSNWYKDFYQVELNPETEILPLLGSKEGIMHISLAFLNPGDEVLVPDPGYPAYKAVASLCEAKAVVYDLKESDKWCPDFNQLEKMDLSNVKLMWVNYPNMPTGKSASKKLFEQLITFCKKHRILIVNDNPYSLISTDKPLSILSVNGSKEITIELNSLSKSHNMAGWRVGMIGANSHFIQAILKVKSNMDSGMFKPIQLAATIALQNTADWYKTQREVYTVRREIGKEIVRTLKCDFDNESSGMFIWAKIPQEAKSSMEFSEDILQNKKVFITPGFIFGKNGERYIRISLANDKAILNEALNRIIK